MSQHIKSRTPDQCRSHHQKILKFHHNIDNILTIYKERLFRMIPSNRINIDDNIDTKKIEKKEQTTKVI